jgi:hypothetical protein
MSILQREKLLEFMEITMPPESEWTMTRLMEPSRPYKARCLVLPDAVADKLAVVDLSVDHVSLFVYEPSPGAKEWTVLPGLGKAPFPGELFRLKDPPDVILPQRGGGGHRFKLVLKNVSKETVTVQPVLVGVEFVIEEVPECLHGKVRKMGGCCAYDLETGECNLKCIKCGKQFTESEWKKR